MPEVKAAKRSAGWTKVAFGDVVRLYTERSSDPETDGFERYIGLEHLDPGELRVRRWGDLADGVTFTNVFRPGQVLFGKRRAYQRKVAVADFSGVCSGDIYVLGPKGDALLPELLPFICQTDAFFEHAVGTSAGSLSPRTNWESLADFEFALPPIEEQERIAKAAGAIQAAREELDDLALYGRRLQSSVIAEAYGPSEVSRTMRLDDVLSGIIDYRGKSPPKSASGVPLLTARNVRDGFVDPEPREFIPADRFDGWMTRGLPEPGDVLFTTEAPLGNVAVVPSHKFALGQRLVLLRANRAIVSSRYLFWLMRSTPAPYRSASARTRFNPCLHSSPSRSVPGSATPSAPRRSCSICRWWVRRRIGRNDCCVTCCRIRAPWSGSFSCFCPMIRRSSSQSSENSRPLPKRGRGHAVTMGFRSWNTCWHVFTAAPASWIRSTGLLRIFAEPQRGGPFCLQN